MTPEDFEREVRTLLQLQGWQVSQEKLLGHKKIDAYAEKADSLGAIQRVAVECKRWNGRLSQNDVTTIFLNYFPLIEANLIDIVLIVTESELTASAATYVSETRSLRHLSRHQLLNTLIDFRAHLRSSVVAFNNDEVSKRYVAQSFQEGDTSLEEHILAWAKSEDRQPIAILGGYGIGKSTLTKRLAHLFALQCSMDVHARIPVVLQLSSIATDQTLEGLLGRQFTSTSVCPNYNYQLFTTLNSRGRFIFFLDGFDEMKKTMSWDSLVFNLTQLNQLITPQSKVILLGRPSAFLSDEEQDEALHGRVKQLGKERRIPGWPDYRELHIRPFTRQQVAVFIQRHLDALPSTSQEELEVRHQISKYLENIESPQGKRLVDLAARPVQLRMLMELLPEYKGSLDRLTVAILYSEFIDLLLRREAEKPGRGAFSKDQRKRFASRLAYWMWQEDQRSEIDSALLPEELFDDYFKNLPTDVRPADVKRDLLSGAFLERKPPNRIYFPHRSFQEYLVAEELAHMLHTNDERLGMCAFMTPEATSFFIELIGKKGAIKLRRFWTDEARLSSNVHELINTACAHYDLELRGSPGTVLSEDLRRAVSSDERERLLRKLEIVGVVASSSQPQITPEATKKLSKASHHRKGGVTPKHRFRKD